MSCAPFEVPQRPTCWSDLTAVLGDPLIHISPDGFAVWDQRWEQQHMVLLNTTVPYPKRVYCNRAIAENLKSVLCEIYDTGNGDKIITWDGCFHVRRVRNATRKWSLHALGAAVDINARWNPCGVDWNKNRSARRIHPAIVDIFGKHGWIWGQHFRRKDPMHFGICYW